MCICHVITTFILNMEILNIETQYNDDDDDIREVIMEDDFEIKTYNGAKNIGDDPTGAKFFYGLFRDRIFMEEVMALINVVTEIESAIEKAS